MKHDKQFHLENDIVLEFQDTSATPLARFEEYVKYSKQLRAKKDDIDSTEVDDIKIL